jgi:hypothetical protein
MKFSFRKADMFDGIWLQRCDINLSADCNYVWAQFHSGIRLIADIGV